MSRSLRIYIITRAVLTLPMILILLTMVFFVMRVMPGDPVKAVLGEKATAEEVARIREQLGLNRPLLTQYFDYLGQLARLDLGTSLVHGRRPIADELSEKFPATVELAIAGMAAASLIGILTGAFAAHHRKRPVDYGLRVYGIVIYALPVFWMGLMLQLIFSVGLQWTPVAGRMGATVDLEYRTGFVLLDSMLAGNGEALMSGLHHLLLPALTLGLVLSGVFTRITRSNMIEVLQQDYITAARARGVPETRVVYGHALRNAFIPILTLLGLQFALLLAGAVLTETTFSWPGVGRYLVERIGLRDFPAVQGTVAFFGILVAAVSLGVDILYAFLDPRIRY